MSKSLAGNPKALTINCYLPVSLRFHSLSPRSRAMVVTCSRALRRLQVTSDEMIGEFFGPARLVAGSGLAVVTATAPPKPRG